MKPTPEELKAIPSIFSKWTKQLIGRYDDGDGGYCAVGYLFRYAGFSRRGTIDARIAEYILSNYPTPAEGTEDDYGNTYYSGDPVSVLIYANNVLKLSPEDFRYIDKLTQLEAIRQQVDGIEIKECEGIPL